MQHVNLGGWSDLYHALDRPRVTWSAHVGVRKRIQCPVGCVHPGIFGDRFIVKLTRRNDGSMKAEH